MGIRKYRGQIVCDKRWPDGSRIIRKCSNRTNAKGLLARIEAAIAGGTWLEFKNSLALRNREAVTLKQFSSDYMDGYVITRNKRKTWLRKQTSLKSLNRFMGRTNLEAITPAQLHSYVRNRKKRGLANGTINRDIATIKHLFSYAEECGFITSNPIEKFRTLPEDRREQPRYTDQQIQSVIDAVTPNYCKPPFIFIRETGCRREEAFSLQDWQIQEDSSLVVFSENTKSRKFRYVPLTEQAIEAAKAPTQLQGCPYVFYNPSSGTRWHDCRKPWEKARVAAGVPQLQVKDLRRHFAIKLAENGADMHDIQQVLGHASVATTERHYAQFSPRHSARKILRVLEGGKNFRDDVEEETKRKQASRMTRRAR